MIKLLPLIMNSGSSSSNGHPGTKKNINFKILLISITRQKRNNIYASKDFIKVVFD